MSLLLDEDIRLEVEKAKKELDWLKDKQRKRVHEKGELEIAREAKEALQQKVHEIEERKNAQDRAKKRVLKMWQMYDMSDEAEANLDEALRDASRLVEPDVATCTLKHEIDYVERERAAAKAARERWIKEKEEAEELKTAAELQQRKLEKEKAKWAEFMAVKKRLDLAVGGVATVPHSPLPKEPTKEDLHKARIQEREARKKNICKLEKAIEEAEKVGIHESDLAGPRKVLRWMQEREQQRAAEEKARREHEKAVRSREKYNAHQRRLKHEHERRANGGGGMKPEPPGTPNPMSEQCRREIARRRIVNTANSKTPMIAELTMALTRVHMYNIPEDAEIQAAREKLQEWKQNEVAVRAAARRRYAEERKVEKLKEKDFLKKKEQFEKERERKQIAQREKENEMRERAWLEQRSKIDKKNEEYQLKRKEIDIKRKLHNAMAHCDIDQLKEYLQVAAELQQTPSRMANQNEDESKIPPVLQKNDEAVERAKRVLEMLEEKERQRQERIAAVENRAKEDARKKAVKKQASMEFKAFGFDEMMAQAEEDAERSKQQVAWNRLEEAIAERSPFVLERCIKVASEMGLDTSRGQSVLKEIRQEEAEQKAAMERRLVQQRRTQRKELKKHIKALKQFAKEKEREKQNIRDKEVAEKEMAMAKAKADRKKRRTEFRLEELRNECLNNIHNAIVDKNMSRLEEAIEEAERREVNKALLATPRKTLQWLRDREDEKRNKIIEEERSWMELRSRISQIEQEHARSPDEAIRERKQRKDRIDEARRSFAMRRVEEALKLRDIPGLVRSIGNAERLGLWDEELVITAWNTLLEMKKEAHERREKAEAKWKAEEEIRRKDRIESEKRRQKVLADRRRQREREIQAKQEEEEMRQLKEQEVRKARAEQEEEEKRINAMINKIADIVATNNADQIEAVIFEAQQFGFEEELARARKVLASLRKREEMKVKRKEEIMDLKRQAVEADQKRRQYYEQRRQKEAIVREITEARVAAVGYGDLRRLEITIRNIEKGNVRPATARAVNKRKSVSSTVGTPRTPKSPQVPKSGSLSARR